MTRGGIITVWVVGALALALSPVMNWYEFSFVPAGGEPLVATRETGIDSVVGASVAVIVLGLAALGLAIAYYVTNLRLTALLAAAAGLVALVVVAVAALSPPGEGEVGTLQNTGQSFFEARKEADVQFGVWLAGAGALLALIASATAARLPATPHRRKCPKCASRVPFEAKVCRHCGYNFPLDETSRQSNPLY